ESLSTHKLPGGPEFAIAGVDGTRRFSVACEGTYEHPYKPAGKANGHSFKGRARTYVSFVPIPMSKLAKAKASLRDRVGQGIQGSGTQRSWQTCSRRRD